MTRTKNARNNSCRVLSNPERMNHLSRWFSSLTLSARLFVGAAFVIALIGAFYAEENWRGRRDWDRCRRELAARGVELDWTKFVPAPVPDDRNFAMTPFLAPLFDLN